jgi:hypothetical protein
MNMLSLFSQDYCGKSSKLGEFGKPWRLSNNQLYFMRYWPPFRYQNKPYDLDIFRAYPDLGSFLSFHLQGQNFN